MNQERIHKHMKTAFNSNNNDNGLMALLLNSAAAQPRQFNVGEIIDATYLGSGLLDCGGKADAMLDPRERKNAPASGTACKVIVISNGIDPDLDGGDDTIRLSRAEREERSMVVVSIARAADWMRATEAAQNGTRVECLVIGKQLMKGGVLAGLRVRMGSILGFVPRSMLRSLDVQSLIGRTVNLHVEKIDVAERTLVLNPRALVEEFYAERAATTIAGIEVGTVLTGTVNKVLDCGVLVDIGNGICGLMPRLEFVRGFDYQRGSKIDVLVMNKDPQRGRIALSQKRALRKQFAGKAVVGSKVEGARVVTAENWGVFIELEPGVTGLLHRSRLDRKTALPKVGDVVDVVIVTCSDSGERIDLGLAS